MQLQFCGAANRVTGSCFYLDTGHHKVLIDCGMFQGYEDRDLNLEPFPFDPSEIEYVFLTHAHIDHCGRLPMLVKQGFHGRIVSTRATKDLVRVLLQDSAKVQGYEYEKCEKYGGKNCEALILYNEDQARNTMQFFDTYPYSTSIKLSENLEFRMRDAGHILGSSIFEIWVKNAGGRQRKLVFSGDLGQPGQRIVKDPDLVREADYVIVESTYGNRLHKSKDETLLELLGVVKNMHRDGGRMFVPMFAVERAQELLYEFNLFVENEIIDHTPVYLDSPLAQKTTDIFKRHTELYDESARRLIESGDMIFEFDGLDYVADFNQSKRITVQDRVVILAGSGMCTGGRILYHLEKGIQDEKNNLVFSGYQVKGTLGRKIIDGAKTVKINGKTLPVNLKVTTLGGFSAHGDMRDLEYWLRAFGHYPRKVFTVHGDDEIISFWADYIRKNLMLDVHVPELNEIVDLE